MVQIYDEVTLLNLQCHLLLSIHSIGHGNEHRAWLQLGIAIRIAQALRLTDEDSYRDDNTADAEMKRRTFWCCFALDRLIANGKDRLLTFVPSSITTRLPATTTDFRLGRKSSTGLLNEAVSESESIFASTLRVINIMGNIVEWSGAGGRYANNLRPWDPEMPIARYESELDAWKLSLPQHLVLNDANFSAHVADGEGLAFAMMHLLYLNGLCRLHREYVPLVPPPLWDPSEGPCNGPVLAPGPDNAGWWRHSIRVAAVSARQITELYASMKAHDLSPWINPLSGYCLVTSCGHHLFLMIYKWESCAEYIGELAKEALISDLSSLIALQESWPVAAHWVSKNISYLLSFLIALGSCVATSL
jgi:Fungal specific transcription factor domain